jgi:hypothetical protein
MIGENDAVLIDLSILFNYVAETMVRCSYEIWVLKLLALHLILSVDCQVDWNNSCDEANGS